MAKTGIIQNNIRLMKRSGRKYWQLYLCLLPVLAYFVVFHYLPMYGVQIAFRDFNPLDGVTEVTGWGSSISSGFSIPIISSGCW